MLHAHAVKLPAGLFLVGIQHRTVFPIGNREPPGGQNLLRRIHDLATNNIIVLPETRQVTVTLFVQVEKIADDHHQAAGAYCVPDALKRNRKWLLALLCSLGILPVHQPLDNPHRTSSTTGRA